MLRKKPEIPLDAHLAETHAPTAQKIIRSTLSVLGSHGLDGLTTKTISEKSNLSTGIIHHYFDTKDNLVYASYVFLVRNLQIKTLKVLKLENDHYKRLWKMVKIHFGDIQLSKEATSVWPHFWSQAIHDKRASRLHYVYSRRLMSNFICTFRKLGYKRKEARFRAQQLMFVIHGAWIEHRVSRSISNKEELYDTLKRNLKLLVGKDTQSASKHAAAR